MRDRKKKQTKQDVIDMAALYGAAAFAVGASGVSHRRTTETWSLPLPEVEQLRRDNESAKQKKWRKENKRRRKQARKNKRRRK
jgi:hypothetical protein